MSGNLNLNATATSSNHSHSLTAVGNVYGGTPPCTAHGWVNCTCTPSIYPTVTNVPWTFIGSGTNTTINAVTTGGITLGYPTFNLKEVKEITTDCVIKCEVTGFSLDVTLPQKFSDCFLKVGYAWSPLYPLIFSAIVDGEITMSFHIVTTITGKVLEGNDVILKGITTIKIEDNLTLLQLCERTKDFFKDDKTNSSSL